MSLAPEHILAAVQELQSNGVPKDRRSKGYCLVHGQKHFPPKLVFALASKRATGRLLKASDHSGGKALNARLSGLGFRIVECTCGGCGGVEVARYASALAVDSAQSQRNDKALIARLVTTGRPIWAHFRRIDDGVAAKVAEHMVLASLAEWPAGRSAKFLITPGGFLLGRLPDELSGRAGWESDASDLSSITEAGEAVVRRVISDRVIGAAKGKVDAITLGVDLVTLTADRKVERRAELVALVDLRNGNIVRWTGKSYPTAAEEAMLIQVTDLNSHCVEFGDERVLVLGCHDLNMFSPRAWNNLGPSGVRRDRCARMRAVIDEFRPTIILQHPHTTDSPRIWCISWSWLERHFAGGLRDWASGIRYFRKPEERAPLEAVLQSTRKSTSSPLDFVFRVSQTGGPATRKDIEGPTLYMQSMRRAAHA